MPDYNPAIAAQIQPPQAPAQPNFGQTLSTVADFQRAQAATQLSQLQALQAQRKYNGLLAASQALAHLAATHCQAWCELAPAPILRTSINC